MSEQPKADRREQSVPSPRKERIVYAIGHISVGKAERRLDDLHELRQLLEQMAQ